MNNIIIKDIWSVLVYYLQTYYVFASLVELTCDSGRVRATSVWLNSCLIMLKQHKEVGMCEFQKLEFDLAE